MSNIINQHKDLASKLVIESSKERYSSVIIAHEDYHVQEIYEAIQGLI